MRVSANVSDQHAQEDVEMFTGNRVSAKTQQRPVHSQTFDLPLTTPITCLGDGLSGRVEHQSAKSHPMGNDEKSKGWLPFNGKLASGRWVTTTAQSSGSLALERAGG